jgi:hypothetical protein
VQIRGPFEENEQVDAVRGRYRLALTAVLETQEALLGDDSDEDDAFVIDVDLPVSTEAPITRFRQALDAFLGDGSQAAQRLPDLLRQAQATLASMVEGSDIGHTVQPVADLVGMVVGFLPASHSRRD